MKKTLNKKVKKTSNVIRYFSGENSKTIAIKQRWIDPSCSIISWIDKTCTK